MNVNSLPETMDEYYSALYIFNGLQYNVVDSKEVHKQLESDRNFFEEYIQNNAGSLEAVVPVTESVEESCGTALASGEKAHTWTEDSTKLLLDLYVQRKIKFRDPKYKKKKLWTEILEEMKIIGYNGLNEDAIDRKMRNLKKTFRTIQDKIQYSGTGKEGITWLYYETFEELFPNECTKNVRPKVSPLSPTTDPLAVVSTVLPPSPSSHSLFENSLNTGPRNLYSSTSSNESSPEASGKHQQRSRNFKEVYNIRKRLIAMEEERIEALYRLETAIKNSNTLQEDRNELLKTYLDSHDHNFFEAYIQNNARSLEVDVPVPEIIEESSGNDLASGEKAHTWTQNSTKLFLDLYRQRKSKFCDPKYKKKTLWTEILEEMKKRGYNGLNEAYLDRKMRNLKKTFRTIKDKNENSVTGRGRIKWLHYETMEEIFSTDCIMNVGPTFSSWLPTIVPLAVASTVLPNSLSPYSIFEDLRSSSSTGASEKHQQKSRNCKEVSNKKKRLIASEKERIEALHHLEVTIKRNNTLQEDRNELLKKFLDSQDRNFFEVYIENNAGSLEADVPVTVSGEESSGNALVSGEEAHTWTKKSTKLFLDLYRQRKFKFRDPRCKKKNLWTEILEEMKKRGCSGLSVDAIDRKMRNMKKTFRNIKDKYKNSVIGRRRIKWLYYETFEDLFSK